MLEIRTNTNTKRQMSYVPRSLVSAKALPLRIPSPSVNIPVHVTTVTTVVSELTTVGALELRQQL